MNATQKFNELVAIRFCELEAAKLERAEILHNLDCALQSGEITQAQYDELKSLWKAESEQA